MKFLLNSLSVVERRAVKALVLSGARLSCEDRTLVVAYPVLSLERGESLSKRYERLSNGQWQQVVCLDTGSHMIRSVTPLALNA